MTGRREQTRQDTQIWTAARCQRLLRQLQCRLVSLRKLVNEARQPQTTTTTQTKRASVDQDFTKRSKRARYTYGRRKSVPVPAAPTVSPTLTPQRASRTLGSMKIERSPLGVGRIDFTTPVLCRFGHTNPDYNFLSKDSKLRATSSTPLVTELQSLRRIVPDSQYRIYEIIFSWLNGLLTSTEPLGKTAHPKSLLGMCLRKVPDALAVIEDWDRQIAMEEGKPSKWESTKASTELYEQLEGFGTTSIGWRSLKLVVRAHALCLLTTAVAEGLFEPLFVRLLVDLCLSLECRAEAARLVSNMNLHLTVPRGSATTLFESGTIQPLGTILRSIQGQGTTGPSWCCLSTLIKNKKLSPSWLTSRPFRSVWLRGIEVLLHSRAPVASVIDFMCIAINQLLLEDEKGSNPEEAPEDETLINVLAAMAAATWTVGAGMNGNDPWKLHAVRRLLFTLECCMLQQQSRRSMSRRRGLLVVALARFIATGMIDNSVVSLTTKNRAVYDCLRLLTLGNGVPTQPQYRQTLLLACSVAQHRGQASGLPCHDILSEIRTSLNGLGLPNWFQNGLVSDGAFVLAQKTRDLRDVAFAERFPVAGKGTLEASTIFSGWRWEEGIGEWVLPSPGQERRGELRQKNHRQNRAGYETGEDRRPDSRAQTRSLRGTRVDRNSNVVLGRDEDNSLDRNQSLEDRDDTNDIDYEGKNGTSATNMMDGVIEEDQDSGDELGDYIPPDAASEQGLVYTVGKRNRNNVNANTKTKTIKKVKRLNVTRICQMTRFDRAGPGVSEARQVDTADDELSVVGLIGI